MRPPSALNHQSFAVTAPGLEQLMAGELEQIGVRPLGREPGGIAFEGSAAILYAANLRLRTASRILVRVSIFHARSFIELERHARQVPWERFVGAGRAVKFRVTCRKSRLYHSDAVAQRLAAAVEHRTGVSPVSPVASPEGDEDANEAAQLFVVRLARDECTISVDSSGAHLHRRGYRQAVAKAPLRETLAAAMLIGSGWDPGSSLLDPLCGSGTIAIEGAMMARRIAPGLGRRFAVQEWPEFDMAQWNAEVDRARGEAVDEPPGAILASDRDEGAIRAARSNAERAGVASGVEFHVRSLSDAQPISGVGAMVTNPPYGNRMGDPEPLRDLYARLGSVARSCYPGWTVALLSADRRLEAQTGLRFAEAFRTTNGGIPVHLVTAPAGGG